MASITTFFGTQGGGGSVSGTATRVAFFGGTPGSASTTLDDSANLEWDDTNSRLSVGDATTVPSTVTIAGAGASDATSSLEVRTDGTYGNLLLFRVYNNGRIDSRMLNSSEALTDNVAFGINAGSSITTGDGNTVVGGDAGASITQGTTNTIVGNYSGYSMTIGSANVSVGAGALYGAVGTPSTALGSYNVAVGYNAGRYRNLAQTQLNTGPSNCIYIGHSTVSGSASPSNEIVIGAGLQSNGDNTVNIGNSSVTDTFLKGGIHLESSPAIYFDTATGTKIGSTASEKLSLWGKTPIVQPTTSIASAPALHGSGAAVKEDSTFGGYTIGQIVTALQTLGLLA